MPLDFGCNCHHQTSVILPLHADISTYGAAGTCVLAAKYATACRELECCQLTSILIKVSLQIIAVLRTSSSTPACLLLQTLNLVCRAHQGLALLEGAAQGLKEAEEHR